MFVVTPDLLKMHGLPDGWQAFRVAVLGTAGTHVELEGGVFPVKFLSGPRAGTPNYKKPIKGTERTVILSIEEYRRMVGWKPRPRD